MRGLLIPVVLTIALLGCAAMKTVLRTVDDLADAACQKFGADHPEEFEQLVRLALPPGAPALTEAEKNGFFPAILCDIKEVVQPFIDDQLRLQNSRAAEMRASMSQNGLE